MDDLGNYSGASDLGSYTLGDFSEAAKMEPFNPASDSGVPWWQAMIQYGAVRAIDNRFGPTNVAGNTAPGSFGGQNGRSYTQGPAPTTAASAGGMSSLLPLLAIGAVAFAALS